MRISANRKIVILIILIVAVAAAYFVSVRNKKTEPAKNQFESVSEYPDLPEGEPMGGSVTAKYIVEHRSALDGRVVGLKAKVLATLLGEDACPQGQGAGAPCAQPRIFVADTTDQNRDKNYDLIILLGETDQTTYSIGQEIDMDVRVSGNKSAVSLEKFD